MLAKVAGLIGYIVLQKQMSSNHSVAIKPRTHASAPAVVAVNTLDRQFNST